MPEKCPDAQPRPRSSPGPTPDATDYGCVCTLTTQGRTVVQLFGEIDLATSSLVTRHLDQVTADAGPLVVVDLRAVDFIDAAGIDPLVRARTRALRRGGELSLVCTDPRVLRTLRLAGLLPEFPLTAPPATLLRPGVRPPAG